MEARGFIVQATTRVRDGVPVVQLWGRLESGEAFLVEDDRFRPYLFVPWDGRVRPEALHGETAARVEETGFSDLRGRPVLRVTLPLPAAVPPLRERVARRGSEALEADVPFAARYLIDHGVRAGVAIRGEPRTREDGLRAFANPEVGPTDVDVPLTTLSLDLETSPDAGRLYSAALAGCGVEEVHLLGHRGVPGAVDWGSERELLAGLLARIRALDPDVLLGWNVVDFDLKVLERRCRELGVPFRPGRDDGAPRFFQDPGFARRSRADVSGRVVLDGIDLVREALRLPDYRLETVARHVLGRGKAIDAVADKAAEITRMFREEPAALARYNLEDARLVPEILEREGLLALAVERSRLSGMPLDRVSASIASFDRLYLPELRRRGVVAPSVDVERKGALIQGGALLDPQPGLYRDVAVLDFKSLYPSLIRTFHLDPLAHALGGPGDVEAPGGARFSRQEAILPGIIEALFERRAAARARGDRNADRALKIMLNALFGVLGAASCRFFDPAVANAITGFGQQTLRWTREAFEEAGVRVLYGDTDSVFVQLPGAEDGDPDAGANRANRADRADRADRAARAEALRAAAEARVRERIRKQYDVEPRLDLELERIFDRFFLPRLRGPVHGGPASGRGGSKKRYAGWCDGRLVMVGLESVRRDWPQVAHRLQEGLLERLFRDRPLAPFVRDLVARVRAGELDAELVYVKRLAKGALERYTAGTPPHVQAARKLARQGRRPGRVVRYAITASGPEPVVPGRPLPPGIDRGHCVERVLRPVAESILEAVGSSFDEAVGNPTQLDLL